MISLKWQPNVRQLDLYSAGPVEERVKAVSSMVVYKYCKLIVKTKVSYQAADISAMFHGSRPLGAVSLVTVLFLSADCFIPSQLPHLVSAVNCQLITIISVSKKMTLVSSHYCGKSP